jgi:hypothetical protein
MGQIIGPVGRWAGKGEGKTPAAHGGASTNPDLRDDAAMRRFPQSS